MERLFLLKSYLHEPFCCSTSGCLSHDKTVIVVSVFADDACDLIGGTGGLST